MSDSDDMTQLALSFEKVYPAYRYTDGIGLIRCNGCLQVVPCGCIEVPKPKKAKK
jgi:hypothetical protein